MLLSNVPCSPPVLSRLEHHHKILKQTCLGISWAHYCWALEKVCNYYLFLFLFLKFITSLHYEIGIWWKITINFRRFVSNIKWLIITFSYVEKEEDEKLPLQRKKQDKINYCPFDREPHPNEAIQIGVYKLGKGRGDTKSVQENKYITKK